MKALEGSVKQLSFFQSFALVLCVLALFLAQAFGVKLGFVCPCSGAAMLIQTTHCHGPHGPLCHASGKDSSDSHQHNDGEDGAGDRQDHAEVKSALSFVSANDAAQVVVPMALLEAMPLFEVLFAPPESNAAAAVFAVHEDPLPFGVTVARTVVLLI